MTTGENTVLPNPYYLESRLSCRSKYVRTLTSARFYSFQRFVLLCYLISWDLIWVLDMCMSYVLFLQMRVKLQQCMRGRKVFFININT